jgi:hypothetical protein
LQQFCTHKIQAFARDPRIHDQNTTSQQALNYCGRRKTKTKNSSESKEHSSLSLSLSLSLVWQEGEDLRLVTKFCDLKLGDLFLPQKNNRLATKKFQGFPSS